MKKMMALWAAWALTGLLLGGCGLPAARTPADGALPSPAGEEAPLVAGVLRGCVGGSWQAAGLAPPQVEVYDAHHNLAYAADADSAGCYRVEGVAPGSYVLWAFVLAPGETEADAPTFHSTEFVVLTMPEGEGVEIDLVLDVDG